MCEHEAEIERSESGRTCPICPDHGNSTAYKNGCRCPGCVFSRRQYNRLYRQQRQPRLRDYDKGRRSQKNARRRKQWQTDPAYRQRQLDNFIRSRFGITREQWELLRHSQDGRCACCLEAPTGKRPWQVDHDHESGAIRGLLCRSCNTLLGRLGDSIGAVQKSCEMFLAYLRSAPTRRAKAGL